MFTIRNCSVTLASVALTGEKGVTGLSINGQAMLSVTQLPGAASVVVANRGNASMAIQFTALREFATDAALEQFVFAHFGTLVKGGALVFTVGAVSKTATSAAVQSVSFGDPVGLLLPVTYSLISSPLL